MILLRMSAIHISIADVHRSADCFIKDVKQQNSNNESFMIYDHHKNNDQKIQKMTISP